MCACPKATIAMGPKAAAFEISQVRSGPGRIPPRNALYRVRQEKALEPDDRSGLSREALQKDALIWART